MLDKHYSAADIEPRIYAHWEKENAFAAGAGKRGENPETYCIVIPPPNVTGSLHMGHALNNTLQDVLIRFKRMQGLDVLWQCGTDHAGIATQMVVERRLAQNNIQRRDLSREDFIDKIWEWKAESGGAILHQLKRLGASCDWSRERFTMDEGLSQAVRKVFVSLHKKGLIYRGKRLVNWDPKFETAISDLEVDNRDVDGHMWHFKYPLQGGETYEYVEKDADGQVTLRETRDYISIATTRPETMLGDGAVAVHPSDERYAPIVGKLCEIPVGPKEHRRLIPIITDDYPDPDFGSGAVKITGAHDFNDYQVAKRNNIPLYRLMDRRAALRDDGPAYAECAAQAKAIVESGELPSEADIDEINLVPDEYRGLDRYEARKAIVAAINADGLCVTITDDEGNAIPYVESKKIMQPFGDRSQVVIEPMLTDQWFADAETLAKPAIDSVRSGRIQFVPQNWEKTYFDWMENIQPWCISRQLWWGHQIPAWYGPDGEIFVEETENLALEAAEAHYDSRVQLTRDEDVLDTWFSSALWPFSTLGWPEQTPEVERYYQTDVLITGFDIIFFWVARMVMMGDEFMQKEPFHTVYIHALVRDEKGHKMSKTSGNVIDPLDLIEEYGADAVRFTLVAMAAQGRDIRLAKDRVGGYRNFCTKIWNAVRFAEMNQAARSAGFDPSATRLTLNRWIVTETSQTATTVTEALDAYRFNDAAGALYRFLWNIFCDWYVELAKPVLSGDADEAAKAETRATMAWTLDQAFALLHPFMPFLTEELWSATKGWGAERMGSTMLIHQAWPELSFEDEAAASEIGWLVDIISSIRSVRSEMNVPASAQVPISVMGASELTQVWLDRHNAAISRLARVPEVTLADAAPSGSAQIIVGEATVCLPLEGVIDIAAEKKRLAKDIDKLSKELSKLEAKLSNDAFLAKAPEEVIAEQRERRDETAIKTQKLQEAMGRLG